jgi:hypothetical protein
MADVNTWQQAASQNNLATPDGAPEGHGRKAVNNIQREVMAAVRRWYEDPAWIDKLKSGGTSADFAVSRTSDFVVNVVHDTTPTDVSDRFPDGARVRIRESGGTFLEGYVVSTSYVNPNTSVTVVFDDPTDVLHVNTDRLEVHITTVDGAAGGRSVGKAAFSDTGTTLLQYPPEIPTADDLGSAAFKDEGDGNGLDADLLDGQHRSYYENLAALSRPNLLVGGTFANWQRGTVINSSKAFPNDNGAYVCDNFALLMGDGVTHPAAGFGVVNLERSTSVPVDDARSAYSCKITGNANVGGTAEKFGLFQMLEHRQSVQLRKKKVSASVWARISAGSGMNSLRLSIIEWTGAADLLSSIDPVADWSAAGTPPTMIPSYTLLGSSVTQVPTTSWQKFELPNIEVTGNATNVGLLIWVDDQSWAVGHEIYLHAPNFVLGAVTADMAPVNPADDLLRCQRFMWKTFDPDTEPAQNAGTAGVATAGSYNGGQDRAYFDIQFPVPMFAAPDIQSFNPSAANAEAHNLTDGTDTPLDGAREIVGQRGVSLVTNVDATDNYDQMGVHITAEAVL